ncbi:MULTISPECIES: hypothetical protein [Bradyrhizobium]|uniref:hypothetical protein n=1 Tax=Bradyrhizobium TaxID=374 RepID=UPI00067F34B6|nr:MULTISPECIES: hypothetical protein [Bradyrhizobium]PAY03985.1 hypothetical protein CK489_37530 [Bradyrhizobium sp. UFLA03-84]
MFKALIAGAVAVGLIAAPAAAMTTQGKSTSSMHKTHKVHHAQKKMAPGTTTGMSSGTTTGQSTGGAKAKTGY